MDQLGAIPDGEALAFAVVDEVLLVAQTLGVQADPEECKKHVVEAVAQHRGHKPSMLQDVLAGRRTEIETINGAVVAAADQHGVPVHHTRALLQLVRLVEARLSGEAKAAATAH